MCEGYTLPYFAADDWIGAAWGEYFGPAWASDTGEPWNALLDAAVAGAEVVIPGDWAEDLETGCSACVVVGDLSLIEPAAGYACAD